MSDFESSVASSDSRVKATTAMPSMRENRARIAIVAALEREVRTYVRGWAVSEREYEGRRFRFLEKDDVVVVCGGIGAEAARRAAAAVIAEYRPGVVWSVGFAGALDSGLKVGDVIQPQRVVNASDGSSAVLEHGEGVLVSFGAVANPAQKAKLQEAFGALAVDMEAAAVACAAETGGVEFRALKVISDESDFEFPSMEGFVDERGGFSEFKFARFAAVRPWLWPKVAKLLRNSGRASRTLGEQLSKAMTREAIRAKQTVDQR